jgi:hypothetical protein
MTTEQKQKIKDFAAKVRNTMRGLDCEFWQLAAEFGLKEDEEIATHFASDWLHDAVYNCNNETIDFAINGFENALNKGNKNGDV